MDNVSPWIHLAGISDHQLTIWGLILAIDALERCINERVLVSSQDRQASSVCQGVAEEAKRLQGSKSNYERGLSKAVISNDLEAAELEFSTAINQQLPMLYKYYFQRADATLWIMLHIF